MKTIVRSSRIFAPAAMIATVACLAPSARAAPVRTEWVIRDARLRAQVVESVHDYLLETAGDSDAARVLESSGAHEIVVEALESAGENARRVVSLQIDSLRISPTENVRIALGESLYQFVARRKDYAYDATRTAPEDRLAYELWWPEDRVVVALNRQFVRVSPGFAISNEIGNESIQLPFWQYGMFRAGLAHPNFRLLLQGPFAPSIQNVWFLEKRHIDGAFGGAFEFRVENWSGEIAYATMSRQTSIYPTFVQRPFVTYYTYLVQVRYGLTAMLGTSGAVEMTLGAGMHQVKGDTIGPPPQLLLYDARTEDAVRVSPFVRIAFIGAQRNLEAWAQFYNTSLLFSLSMRIVGSIWLSGEALFIKALRPPERYEPDSFFFLTPSVRF